MQEIQEVRDEQQNNIDSLLAHNQVNVPLAEPFAFESLLNTDTYPVDLSSKSIDESLQPENNISNETVPLLTVPNEREQSEIHNCHRQQSNWISVKDPINIKQETITPVK